MLTALVLLVLVLMVLALLVRCTPTMLPLLLQPPLPLLLLWGHHCAPVKGGTNITVDLGRW
jgi:hypothetical protein